MARFHSKVSPSAVNRLPNITPARHSSNRFRKMKPQRCSCGMWMVALHTKMHHRSKMHRLAPLVRKLHDKGMSYMEISRRTKIAHRYVRKIVRRFNRDGILPKATSPFPKRCSCGMWMVAPRTKLHQQSRNHRLAPLVRKLHKRGMSYTEISRRTRIAYHEVQNILRRFNRDGILPNAAPPVPRRCSCGMWIILPQSKSHLRSRHHKFAPLVQRLHKKGLTYNEISRRTRIVVIGVRSIIRSLTWERILPRAASAIPRRCSCGMWVAFAHEKKHQLGVPHKIAREVRRMKKQNLTRQQMAKKLGTKYYQVASVLNRLGR